MKKLEKLNRISILNKKAMKELKGGEFPLNFELYDPKITASKACEGKREGDTCYSGDETNLSRGTCKYAPFAGLICWR